MVEASLRRGNRILEFNGTESARRKKAVTESETTGQGKDEYSLVMAAFMIATAGQPLMGNGVATPHRPSFG